MPAMRSRLRQSIQPRVMPIMLLTALSLTAPLSSVARADPDENPAADTLGPARGLSTRPRNPDPEIGAKNVPDARGRPPANDKPAPSPQVAAPARSGIPVRLASLDGRSAHFSELKAREAKFEIVRPADNPDLVWDPLSRDVSVKGDVVAYGVPASDLAAIIDRTAAIRDIKQITTRSPQPVRVAPDNVRHRSEAAIQIVLSEVEGRSAVVFNISGDGTVEMLYPIGSDPAPSLTTTLSLPLRVREPFGSDHVVAITSAQRMGDLERALLQFNRRQTPGELVKSLKYYLPDDARMGSVAFFTTP